MVIAIFPCARPLSRWRMASETSGSGYVLPGDRGSEGLGELHGVAADTPRGADDQNLLPGCDAPGAQALQGGEPGDRDDRGLLGAQPGGLADQFVLSRSGVFGE